MTKSNIKTVLYTGNRNIFFLIDQLRDRQLHEFRQMKKKIVGRNKRRNEATADYTNSIRSSAEIRIYTKLRAGVKLSCEYPLYNMSLSRFTHGLLTESE